MRVSDIWEEIKEVTGTCEEPVNFRALTRAIELLSNCGLFDPQIGTIDFVVNGGYYIALPRDVKTPIRLNINNNPAFARNRLYEFSPNSPGSQDGPGVGWQWHERGYSCIQDERKLPSKLFYRVTADGDIGSTVRIFGIDIEGRERRETLRGSKIDFSVSEYTYGEVRSVTRDKTAGECYLEAETGPIGRYYGDEEQPEYRVIKLSQTGVAVRMLYRKHVFKIASQDDIIPLHSASAVIQAVLAVRLMQQKKHDEAAAAMAIATGMIGQEQSTRDEGESISATIEIQTAINTNINTNDVLIVADVYDMASDILGGVGRQKLFDRITDAVNALSHKSQWDSLLGVVDLTRAQNVGGMPVTGSRGGYGYFVLPRYVGAVLALNTHGLPTIPRNRWFEFHLNGLGSTDWASCGTWQDNGDVVTINALPRVGGDLLPVYVHAVPENALDEGKRVTIYGVEIKNGVEVEVYRNGKPGWLCPCTQGAYTPAEDAPAFVRFDRITRDETIGFVRLAALKRTISAGVPIELETSVNQGLTISEMNWGDSSAVKLYGHIFINAQDCQVYIYSDSEREGDAIGQGAISDFDITSVSVEGNGEFFWSFTLGIVGLPVSDFDFEITRSFQPTEVSAFEPINLLLGYWYPDELEPKYRVIRVPGCAASNIRIRYRKRTSKVTSLNDVLNLRSRLAVENMLRALATEPVDPQKAMGYQAIALQYLEEEQLANNPIQAGGLQFDPGTSPGHTYNIQ